MGLTVGQPVFDPYTAVDTGRITDQSIQPGEVVDGGTQIVFTVSGTGEEDIVTRTKTVEFSLPEDMDGMIKVEFEQDGAIVDSQYLSSNLKRPATPLPGRWGGALWSAPTSPASMTTPWRPPPHRRSPFEPGAH